MSSVCAERVASGVSAAAPVLGARRRHRDGLDRPRVASALAILGDGQWARFVSSMLYPVGFIAVIDGALDEHEDAVRRVSRFRT